MKNYKVIKKCRSCKSTNIKSLFDIGNLYISSWLTEKNQNKVIRSPLELMICSKCNLVQLKHT